MVNLSLRLLVRQPLNLRLLPPDATMSAFQLQDSASMPCDHAKPQIASSRCSETKSLYCLPHSAQFRRWSTLQCQRSSAVEAKVRNIITGAAKISDVEISVSGGGHIITSPCRGRKTIAGRLEKRNKSVQKFRIMQLAGIITSPCSGRKTIAGRLEKRNKSVQKFRIMQLAGYAQGSDDNIPLGRSAATPKVSRSRSEGLECVNEALRSNSPTASVDDEKEVEGSSASQTGKNSDVVIAEGDVTILTQYMTRHNFVRVLEVSRRADSVLAGSRVLLLDKPGNVHSIYQKFKVLTESYYDILAAIPSVIPEGPVGILGLGAGTVARLILHFWPEIDMHGWELDPGVVQVARNFFDLEELEWKESKHHDDSPIGLRRRRNSSGSYGAWKDESDEVKLRLFQGMEGTPRRERYGRLRVHVGDALGPDVSVEGGFAGLIVDLFAEGSVIPALQQVETWREMREKLKPGGRIMVNCGGLCVEAAGVDGERKDGGVTMRETIGALADAFPGELSITSLREHGDNAVALTGPPPDFQFWRDTLPECLRRGMEEWRPFSSS